MNRHFKKVLHNIILQVAGGDSHNNNSKNAVFSLREHQSYNITCVCVCVCVCVGLQMRGNVLKIAGAASEVIVDTSIQFLHAYRCVTVRV